MLERQLAELDLLWRRGALTDAEVVDARRRLLAAAGGAGGTGGPETSEAGWPAAAASRSAPAAACRRAGPEAVPAPWRWPASVRRIITIGGVLAVLVVAAMLALQLRDNRALRPSFGLTARHLPLPVTLGEVDWPVPAR